MRLLFSLILALLLVAATAIDSLAAKSDTKAKAKKSTTVEAPKTPSVPTFVPMPANSAVTGTAANLAPTSGDATTPTSVPSQLQTSPLTGEQINWDVIASGGGSMSSTNFKLDGTLGQTVAGPSTSTNFQLNSGYWQNFAAAYLCGDVDDNGRVDIGDAVFLVNYIFAGGAAPDPPESGDNDCNARIDIGDAVYLINYIFAGGAAPCAACP